MEHPLHASITHHPSNDAHNRTVHNDGVTSRARHARMLSNVNGRDTLPRLLTASGLPQRRAPSRPPLGHHGRRCRQGSPLLSTAVLTWPNNRLSGRSSSTCPRLSGRSLSRRSACRAQIGNQGLLPHNLLLQLVHLLSDCAVLLARVPRFIGGAG
jgi:hypothetical protein